MTNREINLAMQGAKQHFGRYWKKELSDCWGSGRYPDGLDFETLQMIRNTFGPAWLTRYRLPTDGDSMDVLKGC